MQYFTLNNVLNVLLVLLLGFYIGRYFYFKPKLVNGEQAADFQATLRDGSQFALSDLRGKYVLLDFWGSWCGPCRRENPELVKFYEAYKNKKWSDADGLEVVSVALESSSDQWEAAILRDQLNWTYHIGELNLFDSPIAKLYGIRQIPSKFLINPQGVIVGINMNWKEMRKFLDK